MAKAKVTRFRRLRNDRTGKRYGKWTVISVARHSGYGGTKWLCRCDCGTERVVFGSSLGRKSASCGCGITASNIARGEHDTNGLSQSDIGDLWRGMIRRCYDTEIPSYAGYGARGINVCDRWRYSLAAFIDDMGPRPSSEHSIERIDNNGNYEPSNCRWATSKEQARNRRTNHTLTFNGKTMCLTDWAVFIGVEKSTLQKRTKKGWSIEQVLSPKLLRNRK